MYNLVGKYENEDCVQVSGFEKSFKSNDLPSRFFYFPIFFKFYYVVLRFFIGNFPINQNNVLKLFLFHTKIFVKYEKYKNKIVLS